jgi:vacuolar-type H+-ATPase subunit D/Vma8
MAATRRRLRAIQDRWMPRLEEAGRAVAEALEEQEREEGMRMRWAAERLGRRQR